VPCMAVVTISQCWTPALSQLHNGQSAESVGGHDSQIQDTFPPLHHILAGMHILPVQPWGCQPTGQTIHTANHCDNCVKCSSPPETLSPCLHLAPGGGCRARPQVHHQRGRCHGCCHPQLRCRWCAARRPRDPRRSPPVKAPPSAASRPVSCSCGVGLRHCQRLA
jgi:hypothetical protein